jgi:hypothetical protein
MKVSWSPATSHKVILDANANHNFENAIDLVVKTGLASSSASELFRSLCAEYPPFCQSKRKEIRVAIGRTKPTLLSNSIDLSHDPTFPEHPVVCFGDVFVEQMKGSNLGE